MPFTAHHRCMGSLCTLHEGGSLLAERAWLAGCRVFRSWTVLLTLKQNTSPSVPCTSLAPGTSRPAVGRVFLQPDVCRFQEHGYYGDTDVASGERLCGEGAFLDWPGWLKKSGWTGGK